MKKNKNQTAYFKLLITLFLCFSVNNLWSQDYYLKIANSRIELRLDSSASTEIENRYMLGEANLLEEVVFDNTPTNKISGYDGWDSIVIEDSRVKFNCIVVESPLDIDSLHLELHLKDTILSEVKFCYQVLSNKIRISDSCIEKFLTGKEAENELVRLLNVFEKGGLLLYVVEFQGDNKVSHLINFGYTCITK